MMFKSLPLMATLATALPYFTNTTIPTNTTTSGTVVRRDGSGGVNIVNNLDSTVYAWSVSDRVSHMHTLSAGGGSYQESWQSNDNGGGISIKLSLSEDQSDVLQFEYTQSGDTIFWDMSCIDMGSGSSFTKYGFAVQPSQSGDNCPSVNCGAGDESCAEAYLQPKDDHATHGCPIDTSFQLSLGN
ncbi:hypothetical protein P170DRAFT_434790 [Aspergillus steynii IBT 23096]|uniref:Extracellular thaumatin domain protein n=1 Tax=Aspergillus steynii IBT 23096 TaxID=1392250 RepID=A0A2I2GJL5_9EURO|nr:uncharacterized protein P170DRAFT_434790 [Aspergillus steynii IBT 23096]PLB53068.1 hypothetical protein P170DRAFT_434790 [Aspergillus steynii IBT 23096]